LSEIWLVLYRKEDFVLIAELEAADGEFGELRVGDLLASTRFVKIVKLLTLLDRCFRLQILDNVHSVVIHVELFGAKQHVCGLVIEL